MSANNPSITAADIIEDVESRLDDPGIDADSYLPWISYAYQKTFQALEKCGQKVKQALFEDNATVDLDIDTLEKDISTDIPRFGGIVKMEVKYGATDDTWNPATNLVSSANWNNLHNVSTQYRSKIQPLYLVTGTNLMVIPTAPESGAEAYIRYIKRTYQITDSTDPIDIPYRYIYPIVNYVQAKAIQKENEDYTTSAQVENRFLQELADIQEAAVSEFYNENDGSDGVQADSDDAVFSNPFNY